MDNKAESEQELIRSINELRALFVVSSIELDRGLAGKISKEEFEAWAEDLERRTSKIKRVIDDLLEPGYRPAAG